MAALVPRIPSLNVIPAPGNVCQVELAVLFPNCGSIEIGINNLPYSVDVQPSTICVTPTTPTPTPMYHAPPPPPPPAYTPPVYTHTWVPTMPTTLKSTHSATCSTDLQAQPTPSPAPPTNPVNGWSYPPPPPAPYGGGGGGEQNANNNNWGSWAYYPGTSGSGGSGSPGSPGGAGNANGAGGSGGNGGAGSAGGPGGDGGAGSGTGPGGAGGAGGPGGAGGAGGAGNTVNSGNFGGSGGAGGAGGPGGVGGAGGAGGAGSPGGAGGLGGAGGAGQGQGGQGPATVTVTQNPGATTTGTQGGAAATTATGQSGVTTTGPPPSVSTCANPLLDITVSLLGLNIDIDAYLTLAGLLDDPGNLVGGLPDLDETPTSLPQQYRTKCGKSFANLPGGTTVTAASATDCLQQCETASILATVQAGTLRDCLGATLTKGVAVNNCLYFLGDDDDILDVGLAIDLDDADSFCKSC
ncbi:hypothetical protein B0H67DRAFT_638721 [Lasiosphaeris hirsuta]|uniref:Uncharacterized protein n=1 Tax=Lasiosphaeris hirsuta TaxID=260670 RepID=A0AA40E6M9_9PEZI|nr:hypothetical protein B0H67DRAFT_638721 [Lasiosphaeris hirsuta]